ncbi:response regulator transcription factor [Paenibacillus harenae]|uniref:response regulator transcription factor n=1 Tax=Paenibacillus harenae TaxID=306543 RepID=UPI0004240FEE|nr:helix-turn-helix domain-containing protein [Paenibacillus harenae]
MYKVLFVDLNQHSREKIPYTLDWNRAGFALEGYADTSAAALSLCGKDHFSLVAINMNEAQAEGIELCGRIRCQSFVPIILIGGVSDFQLARKAMYYQVSDYLPDPLSADDLTASLLTLKHKLDSALQADHHAHALSSSENDSSAQTNVIDKVKEYVEEALHQNITLKEISNILHFNCSYLGQKFKCHVNMTFNEYLLQQRMEKAKSLLQHTDMKVYEIANVVGYSEMDWFYKKFKSYTGVSANEYRKMISITA